MDEQLPTNTDTKKAIPPLKTLYFYLTGDCNMACRHCWIAPTFENSDHSQQYLPFELFTIIVDEGKELGISGIKLTGGEPFIHPDIIKILRYIRDKALILTIESNGVALTPHLADLIRSCKKPFISISIDGLQESHEWMRGVKGSFQRVSQGVRCLVETGVHPQVIMAVSKRNKHEIADLARYAQNLGASSVKYNFVTPTSRGETMGEEDGVIPIYEQVSLAKWIRNDLQKDIQIDLLTNLPMAFSGLSSILGSQGNCGRCGIFSILGVLSDGRYALCGIGTSISELCFGHASTNHLIDIWEKTDALNVIRSSLPKDLKGICSHCLVKNICLGHCVANNYYAYSDLLAGHKFCEEAYEEGCFPMTRYNDKIRER